LEARSIDQARVCVVADYVVGESLSELRQVALGAVSTTDVEVVAIVVSHHVMA